MTEHLPGVLICVKEKTKMGWLMKLVVGPNHTPAHAAYTETELDWDSDDLPEHLSAWEQWDQVHPGAPACRGSDSKMEEPQASKLQRNLESGINTGGFVHLCVF